MSAFERMAHTPGIRNLIEYFGQQHSVPRVHVGRSLQLLQDLKKLAQPVQLRHAVCWAVIAKRQRDVGAVDPDRYALVLEQRGVLIIGRIRAPEDRHHRPRC